MFVASLDYTQIVIAAIGAVVSIVNGAVLVIVLAKLRLPSGGNIGAKVEKTHDLAAINALGIKRLNGRVDEAGRDVDAA